MKIYKLNILVFVLCISVLGLFNVFNTNKPTISEIERRTLKQFPSFSLGSLARGEFFREFDEYFADTFIFRESFVRVSNGVNSYKGIKSSENAQLVSNHGDNTFENHDSDNPNSVDVKHEDEEPVTILFLRDRALTLHKFFPDKAQNYASAINDFSSNLSEDIKVYSILVPDQVEFIDNSKYKSLSDPQDYTIQYVNSKFNRRVVPIDVYKAIQNNSDKYLYFRTDHHWTALGAYYAYTSFMNSLGKEYIDINSYELLDFENFLGTRVALNPDLESHPDKIEVFKHKDYDSFKYYVFRDDGYASADMLDMSYVEGRHKYGVFLGGDKALAKIQSGNPNGNKIMIIKDSYANAFIPFLVPHYEEIYIVDPRHISKNIYELIEENGISEVLFLNTVHVTSKNGYPRILKELSNKSN